ncbi:hypothetical protein ARMGADRAFT_1039135 [Armillaria gallica]|uniref:Uncharacterized protein n=1 Tax=Armillaria gallica TaxID=47427 RepID=A0A2H3D094_ARMGA|nr:hypothetical protein ARMGADRAFT_1039135 [Armillaria gallica]
MPKIRKKLGYSRVVPSLSPSLALSITPSFLSINDLQDFQDDSGLLLDALDHADQEDLNMILLPLDVLGMDSKTFRGRKDQIFLRDDEHAHLLLESGTFSLFSTATRYELYRSRDGTRERDVTVETKGCRPEGRRMTTDTLEMPVFTSGYGSSYCEQGQHGVQSGGGIEGDVNDKGDGDDDVSPSTRSRAPMMFFEQEKAVPEASSLPRRPLAGDYYTVQSHRLGTGSGSTVNIPFTLSPITSSPRSVDGPHPEPLLCSQLKGRRAIPSDKAGSEVYPQLSTNGRVKASEKKMTSYEGGVTKTISMRKKLFSLPSNLPFTFPVPQET